MRYVLVGAVLSMVVGSHSVPAQSLVQSEFALAVAPAPQKSQPVTIDVANRPLAEVLGAISKQSGIAINYSPAVIPARQQVSLRVTQVSAEEAVRAVLYGMGIGVQRIADGSLLLAPADAKARRENGVIVGRVVDAKTKRPLMGATVILGEAVSSKVTTAADGAFRFEASSGNHTIHIRLVGFGKSSREVMVEPGKSVTVEVVLESNTSVLDEVVVTGTVIATTRKAIPNPITVITGEEIEKRGITRIEQLFRGEVPGVYILDESTRAYQSSHGLGGNVASKVFARGSSNLGTTAGTQYGDLVGFPTPLKTYVDGVEILDASYLGTIDPQSIEKIEIVTGPQAATVYGSGAMGGVMQIFTKKGRAGRAPEVKLSLRYGMLESNASDGRTPTHHDVLSVMGGTGPEFTYAGTLSYTYSGQWMPALFARGYGMSVGVNHVNGTLTANGSFSATRSKNGLIGGGYNGFGQSRMLSGEYENVGASFVAQSPRQSVSASQTASLNIDYRPVAWWQQHMTVGISQTDVGFIPLAATFVDPSDTLYRTSTRDGARVSGALNSTVIPASYGFFSSTFTVGMSGSSAKQTSVSACTALESSPSYIGCSAFETVRVDRSVDDLSYGGFGRVQFGFGEKLYFTFGIRGERSPNYGEERKIDWTPSNGVAFTTEFGEVTLKLLGSYGRATRAPAANLRDEVIVINTNVTPSQYISQAANPLLRPEYSRGPQGGIEFYYGNIGSFTVNRYVQRVTDLIAPVVLYYNYVRLVCCDVQVGYSTGQFQNVAEVEQHGWELTGNVGLGALSLRGAYTWADSRVRTVPSGDGVRYRAGQSFAQVPTHTGNITAGYAHGPTSINVVANYRGAIIVNPTGAGSVWAEASYASGMARLKQYVLRRRPMGDAEGWQNGHVKGDLVVSHRLSASLTLGLNVVNLGNSFGSEASYVLDPTLGRNTTFSLAYTLPRR